MFLKSKNSTTQQQTDFKMEKDLKMLDPKERLQMLEKLMQYVIPKQQAVSADIDIGQLSDAQLDTLIEKLTKGMEDDS